MEGFQSALNDFLRQYQTPDFYNVAIMGLVLWGVRVVLLKSLVALGRSSIGEKYRITKRPLINDKQLERESVWPLGYFLDFFGCGAHLWGWIFTQFRIYWTKFFGKCSVAHLYSCHCC